MTHFRSAPPGRRRRLAVFLYGLTGGGAQRRTLALVNGFVAEGYEVDLVVVAAGGALEAELDPRARLVPLVPHWRIDGRTEYGPRRGLRTLGSLPALVRYLRRTRVDLLFSAASHVNLVAAVAHALAGRPLPLVLRASNHPTGHLPHRPLASRLVRAWLRAVAGRLYRRADAVVAVSEGVARAVRELTGLGEDRVVPVVNPVCGPDLLARMDEPLSHPWFDRPGPPVVLGCGTFKLQKDFFTLVEAFARLRRTRPARLVLLGDGPLRPRLESGIRALGLERDVLLPGRVANPLPWMRRASLFVLSSLWEGLPGVLIEAMACGCPVVATDCPSGPGEILAGGRYGPLVPCRDPEALAAAMAAVLDAPPPPDVLRARAAMFSVARAVPAYLDLFEYCILRRERGSARTGEKPVLAGGDPSADASVALFRPAPGHPLHLRRMGRMMAAVGLEPGEVLRRARRRLCEAELRCLECPAVELCERWLAAPVIEAGPPTFCPNAGLWRELAAA